MPSPETFKLVPEISRTEVYGCNGGRLPSFLGGV